MKTALVIFEDHTSVQFRPLSWSRPAYEIPCGIMNLRQRAQVAAQGVMDLFLMPLPHFCGLQKISNPDLLPLDFYEQISSYDKVLFLNARYAGGVSDIIDLNDSTFDSITDKYGVVLAVTDGDSAVKFLDLWNEWSSECNDSKCFSTSLNTIPCFDYCDGGSDELPVRNYLWNIVSEIGQMIESDLQSLANNKLSMSYFGISSNRSSEVDSENSFVLNEVPSNNFKAVNFINSKLVYVGDNVRIAPGVAIDASKGPVVLADDVSIMSNSYLEGPLYIGPGSIVKAGSCIYGETAIGSFCKVGGEIAESQICEFSNKQHDGFLGHAVIGSWCNLGAGTNCSDLSNNYSLLSVNYGVGKVATNSRFVGLMMGDHAKSAIGTQFNTATTVGFASNIFSSGFPRAFLKNYTWGDGRIKRTYRVDKAIQVAQIVMERRNCQFSKEHEILFKALADS